MRLNGVIGGVACEVDEVLVVTSKELAGLGCFLVLGPWSLVLGQGRETIGRRSGPGDASKAVE